MKLKQVDVYVDGAKRGKVWMPKGESIITMRLRGDRLVISTSHNETVASKKEVV